MKSSLHSTTTSVDKSRVLIILQARSTSQRLPGKVRLLVGGLPLCCLVAKRAMNTGLKLVVATSDDPSDDALVEDLMKYQINYFRGSLPNVHQRFQAILASYPEDTIVVRLTGDNPFPDGKFIEEGLKIFIQNSSNYIRSDMDEMPYGLSIEVFTKKAFDSCRDLTDFDKEHVTPRIRNKFGDEKFFISEFAGKKLRCTIDFPKDYEIIAGIFNETHDSVNESVSDLILRLRNRQQGNRRLCLGTVQWGMSYGISNSSGRPSEDVAHQILQQSFHDGVNCLDTARAYAESEKVIGSYLSRHPQTFQVCTKLAPDLNENSIEQFLESLQQSVDDSLKNLGLTNLDTLIFHRLKHALVFDEAGPNYLQSLKKKGQVKKIGVSINDPEELKVLLKLPWVEHVQLPFNLIDRRWDELLPELNELSNRATIHVRSAFLQGLLLLEDQKKWPKNLVKHFDEIHSFLKRIQNEFQKDVKEIALAYCLGHKWIDALVIGTETLNQAHEIVQLMKTSIPLDEDQLNFINDHRPRLDLELLSPSNWILHEKQ